MITYKIEMIAEALKEICRKFVLTRTVTLKHIEYVPAKNSYKIITQDGSKHIIEKKLINQYIESLGDKGGLEIAGLLLHSVELEESAFKKSSASESEDFWDGDIQDALDYLNRKEE